MRSSSAPVSRSEPKISVHSSKGRLLVIERRGALVALADGLEEQLGAGLRQRHIAQFVDDQQFVGGHLLLEALSKRFSSRASISSPTSAAAVMKRTR